MILTHPTTKLMFRKKNFVDQPKVFSFCHSKIIGEYL